MSLSKNLLNVCACLHNRLELMSGLQGSDEIELALSHAIASFCYFCKHTGGLEYNGLYPYELMERIERTYLNMCKL